MANQRLDKDKLRDFLVNDNDAKIIDLINRGLFEHIQDSSDRDSLINYILVYSKYKNEVFKNSLFIDAFLNSDVNHFYANLYNLNNETCDYIIKQAASINKDNYYIARLLSYFNKDYVLSLFDNWSMSLDIIYILLDNNFEIFGKEILKRFDIDLMSPRLDVEKLFANLKCSFLEEYAKYNKDDKSIDVISLPASKINKDLANLLWNKYDIFRYRKIINEAAYSCDITPLNDYAKEKEDSIIMNYIENSLLSPYDEICRLVIEQTNLDIDDNNYYDIERKFYRLINNLDGYVYERIDYLKDTYNLNGIIEYLQKLCSNEISNYIIDYHFEENYYNVMYDLKELLDFYYAGNITISKDRVDLYTSILNIDDLTISEKKELHSKLKKINMIEMFYDDMAIARKIVRTSIKESAVSKEQLLKYKDDELSKEYGVDVYRIDNEPFFALVKSGRKLSDTLPTGHSFSIVGNNAVGVFGDVSDHTTFVYDSDDLNSDQIVHVFPQDSFTYYKPFEASKDATRRVEPLLMVDELIDETRTYNELLILEKGKKSTDFDKDIPELQKIALYCVDKISNEDVQIAKINGVGIFLVNSKEYAASNYEVQNLYRNRNSIDYFSYNYFNGYYEKELHENRRLN